jgi:hypothetical protein
MDADEAHHDCLIENAEKAYRRTVTIKLALGLRGLRLVNTLTFRELVEMTSAEAACVAADKALSEWREGHAR